MPKFTSLVLVGLLASSTHALAQSAIQEPPLTGPSIRPDITVDQDAIIQGKVPFRKIQESGRHLFSTPFTLEDGYGEGPDGPRMTTLRYLQQRAASGFNFPIPARGPDSPQASLLRLNGLDARDCAGCHNFTGMRRLPDTASQALAPRASANGGAADAVANAYINPALQDQVACSVDVGWVDRPAGACKAKVNPAAQVSPGTPKKFFMFARNPPHVFGTGYVQRLAEEMSLELYLEFTQKAGEALNEQKTMTVHLSAKGTDFGYVVVKPKVKVANIAALTPAAVMPGNIGKYVDTDYTNLNGVSEDLIVRPFQWKGVAQNERNFVRDALDFHFSMESTEGRECNGPAKDHGPCINDAYDDDRDGKSNEFTYGNVTALTVFTMSIRPPKQVIPKKGTAERTQVDLGEALFKGKDLPDGAHNPAACSSCHTPSLHIYDPRVTVADPRMMMHEAEVASAAVGTSASQTLVGAGIGLPAPATGLSPTQALIDRAIQNLGGVTLKDFMAFGRMAHSPQAMRTQLPGYTFDLSMKDFSALPLSSPRLPEKANNGGIDVPLFSDLKRHRMGADLCDQHPQTTDNADVPPVPVDEFLTRPLWGVADTGPWLHDGRAFSLESAILQHAGGAKKEGNFVCRESEANAAVKHFRSLSADQRQAIIAFLETLRLPIDPRYGFDEPPQ